MFENQMRKRILIVEDFEANILVCTLTLEAFGYDFAVARNGKDAIAKFQQESFDLILMDVQMPEIDGYRATYHIREHEKLMNTGRIPIIGLTAYAMSGDREKCLNAGMDDYITKPFNSDELEEKLKTHCFPNTAIVQVA